MKQKKILAIIASMLIVTMSSSTLVFADVAQETKVKYLTPEVLMALEEGLGSENDTKNPEEVADFTETETEVSDETTEEETTETTEASEEPEADVSKTEDAITDVSDIEAAETEVYEESTEVSVVEEETSFDEDEIIAPSEEILEVTETNYLVDASLATPTTDGSITSALKVDPNITGTAGFVARIYVIALERQYDQQGLDFWCNELSDYKSTGLRIFQRITDCPEFKERQLTDDEYLKVLYTTFFDREPDGDGFKFWQDKLANDPLYTREFVLNCFVDTEEWANICASYGILSGGNHKATVSNPTVSEGCVNFVQRLYSTCFGREADEAGLNHWCREISNLNYTGKYTARYFLTSAEFRELSKDMTDEELITVFYHVFFDREPDYYGMDYWLGEISLGSKIEILFNGFSDSAEFKEICDKNGIYAGPSIPLTVTTVVDSGFKKFLQSYCNYGMKVLESAELQPKTTYRYSDIQSSERKDYEYNIPTKDIAAFKNFEAAHFDDTWTPAMKVAYMFYWVHENMIYARGGQVAPTYAVAALERKYGQCAQYNGVLVEYLCYLGYDACLVKGWRGRTGPTGAQHYWGELYVNGETYVIEVGNRDSDGSWNYFFVPYSYTRKYIVCGVVQS